MVSMVYRQNMDTFPRSTMLEILKEIQKFMKSIQCEPEEFEGRIIFMTMFDETRWGENDTWEECNQNSIEVSKYARRFHRGHGLLEKTWYKTCAVKPNKEWDGNAASMILQLVTESRHPVFRSVG